MPANPRWTRSLAGARCLRPDEGPLLAFLLESGRKHAARDLQNRVADVAEFAASPAAARCEIPNCFAGRPQIRRRSNRRSLQKAGGHSREIPPTLRVGGCDKNAEGLRRFL